MMICNRLFCIAIIAFLFHDMGAQELILPLDNNAVITSATKVFPGKKAVNNILLELPFLDDFSNKSHFPDPALWADRDAFINHTYPINPVSSGVATLDAINEVGSVYGNATIYPKSFNADHLTSHPINLNYPASDSIYLSFYYQSTGRGLMPLAPDSLCVDFYKPNQDKWTNVWHIPGDTIEPFKQILIPVSDTAFLKNAFKFRFRNRASMPINTDYIDKRGNVDHWHIDYVRLGRNRSFKDTIIRDVAFSAPLSSMLKDYESIPWDHIQAAHSSQYLNKVYINYFNNDTAVRNITRYLKIKDMVSNEIYTPGSPTTQDIFPGETTSFGITSVYPFNFGIGDTAQFEITSYLRTDDFDNKANDTMTRIQIFRDYFAYDDGTAERAYGLRGRGTSGGIMAVRFESFIPDQLGGIEIYFTQLMDSLNLGYYYSLKVWDDDNGEPGNLIYNEDIDFRVTYSEELNKYKRIKFEYPVPVNGIFYVGIHQYNTYMLNIGLDVNNPASGNLIYTTGNEWKTSLAPGSLMVRPFVKRYYSGSEDVKIVNQSVSVYPNPASEYLYFNFPGSFIEEKINIQIFNISGQRVVSEVNNNGGIYIGHLPEGIYIVTFQSEQFSYPSEKIIISK